MPAVVADRAVAVGRVVETDLAAACADQAQGKDKKASAPEKNPPKALAPSAANQKVAAARGGAR